MLLETFLEESAQRRPEKIALVCGERRYAYRDIEAAANSLARGFTALGVARGDRVCVQAENSAEAVVAAFAALKSGGAFLLVNPEVKPDKLAYILRDSGAKVFVAGSRNLAAASPQLGNCPALAHVIAVEGKTEAETESGNRPESNEAGLLPGPSHHRYLDFMALPSDAPPRKSNIDLDLAALIYTSGSTGNPKGVALTHLNMTSAAASITTYLQNQADDIILSCLPLAFDYGLYQAIMAFRFGGTLVLEKRFGFPRDYLRLAAREKVTGLPVVPTLLTLLLEAGDLASHDLSHLRYVTNTAQALPPRHIERLRGHLPHARIFSMYGLTECKRVSYLPPERLEEKPTSVGIAIPNTELWLEDGEGRRILEPGVIGELMVRGAHVMLGYWNSPDETAKRLRPGLYPWERVLRTGDLFRMDAEGFLYFVARKDDLIKTAGERVGPKEIENVLYELAGVREAAVIGVPDEVLGQAVKAFVTVSEGASLTEADVIRHCQRRLERFMVPKFVEFRDELPKTESGKIRKQGLT